MFITNGWKRPIYRNAEGGAGGGGDAAAATAASTAQAPVNTGAQSAAPIDPKVTAAAAGASWYEKLGDQSINDLVVTKGWNKDLSEAGPNILKSYAHLEKLIGAEKAGRTVEIPDFDKADEATLKAFNTRMGVPEDASKYDLKLPAGGASDTEFSNAMAGVMHKAGVPARQASALAQAYQEFETSRNAANTIAEQQRYEGEDKALKTEWGAAYDNKMSLAKSAAQTLGVKAEQLDALQKVAGYGQVMKMFADIAGKVGEDNFVTGERPNTNGKMTPAEASVAMKTLMNDKDARAALMDKYHPKHAEVKARKAQLASWEVGQ